MPKLTYLLALPILPITLALAWGASGPVSSGDLQAKSTAALHCRVQVTRGPHGTTLKATATADRNMSAGYRFTVEKTGSGGSSTVAQSGDVVLTRGKTEVLGAAALGAERRTSYKARLVLENGRGVVQCTAEESS
jgi:hypothetical protein